MDLTAKREANAFFENIAESLDITDTQYGTAESRYKALGEYLIREKSILKDYSPNVHPQGSFLLGTVVKPIGSDEFDIDLVCEVVAQMNVETQKSLKDAVGYEVKGYGEANGIKKDAKEGKRCWTLEYAEGANFHMDVLPAIPAKDRMKLLLETHGYETEGLSDMAIAITDNTHPNYSKISDDWYVSNPKGYCEWFKGRMRVRLDEAKKGYARQIKANVEDVPDYRVKTPLQRAIQILKRHRDIMFQEDMDNKPISIIITTLAAWAYNNEDNVVDALESILAGFEGHIEVRDGETWIGNPVNPLENFADKWPDNRTLEFNFITWLEKVRNDIGFALTAANADGVGDRLKDQLGENLVIGALNKDGQSSFGAFLAGFVNHVVALRDTWSLPKHFWPHRQEPEWPMALIGNVTIRAYIGEKELNEWSEFSSGQLNLPVLKSLRFEATTDIRPPYKVYWQVVNNGYYAAKKNDLRGSFLDGEKGEYGEIHHESTAYPGLHWIACFIVKEELVVARSEQFYVHIV